jgi:hypothetical protein
VLLLALALALVAGCAAPSGATAKATPTATSAPPTPTATPTPTCANVLPGSTPINLAAHGFVYPITYPASTVSSTITTTASGTGLFTVYQFSACTPSATIGGVQSFYNTQLPALPHGWIGVTTFPADGGLMTACAAPCFWDPKGGDLYYIAFDQFSDHGNGVVTYRGRWAVFAIAAVPTCIANFTSGPPAQTGVFFIGGGTSGFPLPPFSDTAPDDAAGGFKGMDVCSPGNGATVTAFLNTEVPAAGWTKVNNNDPHCTNPSNCWTKGGQFWSWNPPIGDATDWVVSYRQPLP